MRKENNARVRYLNQHKPLPARVDYLKNCKDEESRLRAVISAEFPYHLPEFEIALHTGLRRSEQYRAVWSDVDFSRRVLTIPMSKHGETRHVPINSIAMAMFEFLQARAHGTDHVFLSMRNDEPLSTNRHWFEDAVKKAGIEDFHWHDLRHTFGSRLTMAAVGLRQVQELMGHKTVSMTCRYSHLEPAHRLAAVERLVSYNVDHGNAEGTQSVEPTATTSATKHNRSSESGSGAIN
jgi:integrase